MTLKEERLPVSFTELFTLLECLKKRIIFVNVDDFDFSLQSTSPCIDSGKPNIFYNDFDGLASLMAG